MLTAWEPLAIHPQVRANRALIGLGCNLKKVRPLKLLLKSFLLVVCITFPW